MPEPGAVQSRDGDRRGRSGLRPRHRLLPVRAAVPAPRPGRVQRHRRRRPGARARALRGRGDARRPRLRDAGPRPPGRARRAVPGVGRLRLPARQVRARVQHARHRQRRQLHRPERAVPRVRRPDRHVGARGGPPRRRCLHRRCCGRWASSFGLVHRLDRRRTHLPRGRPAPHGRAQPVRPGGALHPEQHRDDSTGVRPPGLGGSRLPRRSRAHRGHDRGRGGHLPQRAAVGLPAARRHARPAPDRPPVLRLRGRRHRSLRDRRRAAPGDALRARAGPRAQSGRRGFVNERIIYTHGIGVAMVPVNEVTNEGLPRLFIRDLPPVSTSALRRSPSRASTSASARSSWVVTGARQPEFDYPTGEGEGTSGDGTTTRWGGSTGIASTRR